MKNRNQLSPLIVGYQGHPGSFSNIAARKWLKQQFSSEQSGVPLQASNLGADSFAELFAALKSSAYDFIVIPLENSIAGSVHQNYDLLLTHEVEIVGELFLKINHFLLSLAESVEELSRVFSHPKALEQCLGFLSQHPKIEAVSSPSTTHACLTLLKQTDQPLGAIASKQCAELYQLKVLASNIQDYTNNLTRFVVVKRKGDSRLPNMPSSAPPDVLSLILQLNHQPGALFRVLQLLAKDSCNLLKIESRPISEQPFHYNFYLDFEAGNSVEEDIVLALRPHVVSVKRLGKYPRGGIFSEE